MKKYCTGLIFTIWLAPCLAQNVGINTINATKAKLEVMGVAGAGATSAAFGTESSGISFQRNWPTIGFNQYRDAVTPGSQGKYMSTGFAAIQYFDPGGGIFAIDLFPSGAANTFTPGATRAITVDKDGNTSIRGGGGSASLSVGRGSQSAPGSVDGTAAFAGPTHTSHFNYSVAEDTYIRAGLDKGAVYINAIPQGPVIVGTTSARIGLNSAGVAPTGTIEITKRGSAKAFTLVDAYNYRWNMTPNYYTTASNGSGVHLDYYYNNLGRSRFQFWNGDFIPLSDRRMKTDIQPLEPVLEKVGKLKPVKYEMLRNNPDHVLSIGMVAQDVMPLFPQMVHTINDHNFSAGKPINGALVMDYSAFNIIAIKALQEQQVQIKALEKELKDLVAEITAVGKRL